jgi:NYN domain
VQSASETGIGKRAVVYIDGLNLYGSALKNSQFKWVDLMALSASLLPPDHSLEAVKYFSADLHPKAAEDPMSLVRQRHYLKALQATGVDVRRGTFVLSTRWRTLSASESWSDRTRPPLPAGLAKALDAFETKLDRPMKVRVQLPEEKFTDVAIGVELVDDFHRGHCELCVLVTNDADLGPAISTVVQQGHRVHVVSPGSTVNRHLSKAASSSISLPPTCLEDHQLPDEFTVVSGARFSRPNAWKSRK